MAVLLKNLVARTPQTEDLDAITELIALCESVGYGMMDSSLEDLLSHWHRTDFHQTHDAWVIVTTRGQIVGFACIWHEDHTHLSTAICIHPDYRNRGIGTLLLRMAEERARQHSRLAEPEEHMVLLSQVSRENESAHRLFEREGYRPGRQFLRIAFALAEDTGEFPVLQAQKRLRADVSVEQGRLVGAAPLYDRDGLCSVRLYKTYEKDLHSVYKQDSTEGKDLEYRSGPAVKV